MPRCVFIRLTNVDDYFNLAKSILSMLDGYLGALSLRGEDEIVCCFHRFAMRIG